MSPPVESEGLRLNRQGSVVGAPRPDSVLSPSSGRGRYPPETFDLSEVMRGATAGKAVWNTHFKLWQAVPTNILLPLVTEIRKRKGLPPEPPNPAEFIDKE